MEKFLKRNKAVVAELVTYLIMAILGIATIAFPIWGYNKPNLYSAILFLILTFFSFGGYFYTKEDKVNYELLIFSVISILVASYFFVYGNIILSRIIGTGYLCFTVLSAINRLYYIRKLRSQNNDLWLLRAIALILLLFIAILSIQNFYRSYSVVKSLIIGYYFLSYGLIAFIEMLLFITISPKEFKKFVDGDFSQKTKLKKINQIDSSSDKLDKIIKNVSKNKKKLHKQNKK